MLRASFPWYAAPQLRHSQMCVSAPEDSNNGGKADSHTEQLLMHFVLSTGDVDIDCVPCAGDDVTIEDFGP